VLADLGDAHFLAGEDRTQIHFPLFVADATAGRDDRCPVVKRILELAEAAIRSWRPHVIVGGHTHVECLMRPFAVIARDERIEARLLLQEVQCRGLGRFAFQRQMHALVAAILLGMTWLDALDADAQAQPPHRQACEAIERVTAAKRDAVVGANRDR
jgi:hypothetical protein